MKPLTEQEIIRVFTSKLTNQSGVPLGYSDDVSAIPLSSKSWIISKTDMLVGSTDIPPGMTLREAARKAVVATVSDFAAKGVRPRALMVSIGMKSPVVRREVQEIASGLVQAAREYDCKIIGGDTNQTNDLVIDIVGIGMAKPTRMIRRDGARARDIVAVTGPFGRSAAGLRIMMSKNAQALEKYRTLVASVRHPRARLSEGISLGQSGVVTSSIDSSDGLALSLHQIAESSSIQIRLDKIPIAPEAREFAKARGLAPFDIGLYGGEEYELVFTVKPNKFASLKRRVPSMIGIGVVERGRGVVANIKGHELLIRRQGWEHFS